ncbi:hypothetical protein EJB05_29706, partial [Eragrostis curvula]
MSALGSDSRSHHTKDEVELSGIAVDLLTANATSTAAKIDGLISKGGGGGCKALVSCRALYGGILQRQPGCAAAIKGGRLSEASSSLGKAATSAKECEAGFGNSNVASPLTADDDNAFKLAKLGSRANTGNSACTQFACLVVQGLCGFDEGPIYDEEPTVFDMEHIPDLVPSSANINAPTGGSDTLPTATAVGGREKTTASPSSSNWSMAITPTFLSNSASPCSIKPETRCPGTAAPKKDAPSKKKNQKCIGFRDFMRHEDLEESGCLKDDRFTVKCDISFIGCEHGGCHLGRS